MIADFKSRRLMIRSIVTAAMILISLNGAARESYAETTRTASPAIGTWTGESNCVGDRPACKNEVVVYRVEAVAGKPGVVTMFADKIINGQREPMGKFDCQYDEAKGTLSCEFIKRQTHGLWQFQISGDTMEGTLVILPARSLGRRIKVKRVRDDQVPAAPARESYEDPELRVIPPKSLARVMDAERRRRTAFEPELSPCIGARV
jgi:hypothetical protein